MKYILASCWFEYIISRTRNHHILNTQLLYTSPVGMFKLCNSVSDWCHDCCSAVNDGTHGRKLTTLVFHSLVLYSPNSKLHFLIYVIWTDFIISMWGRSSWSYAMCFQNTFLSLSLFFFENRQHKLPSLELGNHIVNKFNIDVEMAAKT